MIDSFKEKLSKKLDEIMNLAEEQGFIQILWGKNYRLTEKGKEEITRFSKKNPLMHFLIFADVNEFFKKKGLK